MRAYTLIVKNDKGETMKQWSSVAKDGGVNSGALMIDIDAPITSYAIAENAATITLSGISLDDIKHAANMVGMNLTLNGGMMKGLPLANPAQQGLLLQGQIIQCFSNWIGTAQTLSFVVMSNTGTILSPQNIVFNWAKGQLLSDALNSTLLAYIGNTKLEARVTLRPDTTGTATLGVHHNCKDLAQFAKWIKPVANIDIFVSGSVIFVYNNYDPTFSKIPLNFQDMIGQPSWINNGTVQFFCVMRGDLKINDVLTAPKNIIISSPGAFTQNQAGINKNGPAFSGDFKIIKLRHVGNSRSPNALDWMTVIDCTFLNP